MLPNAAIPARAGSGAQRGARRVDRCKRWLARGADSVGRGLLLVFASLRWRARVHRCWDAERLALVEKLGFRVKKYSAGAWPVGRLCPESSPCHQLVLAVCWRGWELVLGLVLGSLGSFSLLHLPEHSENIWSFINASDLAFQAGKQIAILRISKHAGIR